MQRVTRQEAATHLHVSEATVDRMIRRGDLPIEKEPQGSRYRVWVLLDEDTVTIPADNGVYPGDETADNSVDNADGSNYTGAPTVYSNGDELKVLRDDNERLRELAGYRKQLLDDSEWRYQEPPAAAEAQPGGQLGLGPGVAPGDSGVCPVGTESTPAALVAVWQKLNTIRGLLQFVLPSGGTPAVGTPG